MTNPGKFEGSANPGLADHLYEITMDGMCDEELGDVDGFGWYGLILPEDSPLPLAATAQTSYIVSEDSQGFFDYEEYATPALARKAWAKLEAEYTATYLPDGSEDVNGRTDY